jgi:hypothetical protein
MTRAITVAPVRKSIRVRATPERAFDIFTAGMSRWWNRHEFRSGGSVRQGRGAAVTSTNPQR